MTLILLIAAISFASGPLPPPLPTAPVDDTDRVGLGSCIGQDGPVELRRSLFLENRELDFIGDGGPMRIALMGQTVRISAPNQSEDGRIYSRDIGESVSEERGTADVNLKLALFEGRLVVYWRETVQHRIYRQGLFRVNGLDLTALCEGRAGFESSH
jgi:hypothetical protein